MYCAPFVIQHLTGSMAPLQNAIGDKDITGVYMPLILKSLRECNVNVVPLELRSKPTCLGLSKLLGTEGTFVVGITGHVLLYQNGRFYDNSHRSGTWPAMYTYRKHKVDFVGEVQR